MRFLGLDFGKEEGRWKELAKATIVVADILIVFLIYIFWTIEHLTLGSLTKVFGYQDQNGRPHLDYLNNLLLPILAGLAVAVITGGFAWAYAQAKARRQVKEKLVTILDAAPRQYVEELDKLIARAMVEGPPKAIINARAIVGVRNSLRSSLVSVSRQLNSQIDRLALEIGEVVQEPAPPSVPRSKIEGAEYSATAFETIEVLSRTWPTKKVEIENEIRKLLSELRLDPDKLFHQL